MKNTVSPWELLPHISKQFVRFFEKWRIVIVYVILDNDSVHRGDPARALAKRRTPPVALLLAPSVPAELVPAENQQRMAPAASDVLHRFRIQLIPEIIPIVDALDAFVPGCCSTRCRRRRRYVCYGEKTSN